MQQQRIKKLLHGFPSEHSIEIQLEFEPVSGTLFLVDISYKENLFCTKFLLSRGKKTPTEFIKEKNYLRKDHLVAQILQIFKNLSSPEIIKHTQESKEEGIHSAMKNESLEEIIETLLTQLKQHDKEENFYSKTFNPLFKMQKLLNFNKLPILSEQLFLNQFLIESNQQFKNLSMCFVLIQAIKEGRRFNSQQQIDEFTQIALKLELNHSQKSIEQARFLPKHKFAQISFNLYKFIKQKFLLVSTKIKPHHFQETFLKFEKKIYSFCECFTEVLLKLSVLSFLTQRVQQAYGQEFIFYKRTKLVISYYFTILINMSQNILLLY